MLANQLVRHGVRPMIIDRHPGPARETRALGVQARTLEIYQHLASSMRALALGKRATGADLWAEGHHTARIPLGDIGRARVPIPSSSSSDRTTTSSSRREPAKLGIDVQWNTELVGVAQDADAGDAPR